MIIAISSSRDDVSRSFEFKSYIKNIVIIRDKQNFKQKQAQARFLVLGLGLGLESSLPRPSSKF